MGTHWRAWVWVWSRRDISKTIFSLRFILLYLRNMTAESSETPLKFGMSVATFETCSVNTWFGVYTNRSQGSRQPVFGTM